MARIDPMAAHRFKIEIDGLIVAHFQAVSGISSEHETVTHSEGGRNHATIVLPGQRSYGAVTLKRGYTDGASLQEWIDLVAGIGSGEPARMGLSVIMLGDDARTELGRYVLEGAWPQKWTIEELSASGASLAIETLELAHEGLEFVAGGRSAIDAVGAVARRAASAARAARAARQGLDAVRSAAAAAADAARGGANVAATAGAAAQSVGQSVTRAAASASAGLQGAAVGPAAMAEAWAAAAGGAGLDASGLGAAGFAGGVGAGGTSGASAEVAVAMAEGQAAATRSLDATAADAGVSARGFARGGGAADEAATAGDAWSDGVAPVQAAAGFDEPGFRRR